MQRGWNICPGLCLSTYWFLYCTADFFSFRCFTLHFSFTHASTFFQSLVNHPLHVVQRISFSSLRGIFDYTVYILLSLHSNILTKSHTYTTKLITWCDIPFCLCRSSAILWQGTAGVSPVTANQWVAPLCTTGPQCAQVLGGKYPGNLGKE